MENQLIVMDSEFGSEKPQRTWSQRTFGPLHAGSMRGSIFTLAATAMGAGYLAIPRVLQLTGILLGLAIISFCGVLNYFSLNAVSRACFHAKVGHYSSATESIFP